LIPQPGPGNESKGYERQGLIAAVVVALITTFGFAFTLLQANLSEETRILGYAIVLVSLLALFFGVGYAPLKEYNAKIGAKSRADRIAEENLPRLVELAREFRNAAGSNYAKAIGYSLNNIVNQVAASGRALPRLDATYHFDNAATTIERLAARKDMDYQLFFELGTLLNSQVNEFDYRLQDLLLAIRKAMAEGVSIQKDLLEAYRDARNYYVDFQNGLEKFGKKLDVELGVAPSDFTAKYHSPFHSYMPPKEL
jgi:hypothetical protein